MNPDLYLWGEALARQRALRREVAMDRLAASLSKPPRLALRLALARGLRELADRLDGPFAAVQAPELMIGDRRSSCSGIR